MRFQNNTESVQQVNRIAGESQPILPKGIVEIGKLEVYDFELERIRKIFTELPEESKEEFSKPKKATVRTETSESSGEGA